MLDDEKLEVASSTPIDIDRQIGRIARAQARRLAARSLASRKKLVAAEADYAACIATKGPACTLAINAGALVNKQLIAALVLLGAVALIPVVWRKRRQSRDA